MGVSGGVAGVQLGAVARQDRQRALREVGHCRATDSKATNGKATDSTATDSKATDSKVTDSKVTDSKALETLTGGVAGVQLGALAREDRQRAVREVGHGPR